MKKTRSARRMHKMLIAVAALTLVLGVAIGGTIAYLVATAGPVTNTFTVGNINITLDETDVDKSSEADRDTSNTYKVIPGQTIKKDPIVHVQSGSEKCYVFVKVVNTMKVDGTVVATPNILGDDWEKVGTVDDGFVYVYKGDKATDKMVDAAKAAVDLTVFTEVEIADGVAKKDIDTLKNKTIVIDAYAHQSAEAGYNTALSAALTHFGATAITSGT